jgi:hypothetical protein
MTAVAVEKLTSVHNTIDLSRGKEVFLIGKIQKGLSLTLFILFLFLICVAPFKPV